ncbi:MAG: AMIN domain-containing protein [Peptoclostridium sp.]|uniref:N-acetylmuramoyl-L-alanine amidase family protein n=1 Tax=Peptoclostridium sp. TaxID=1904860 RepID=UPI00139DCCD8|nr:N-acetylmuramoyl-L-alanine amidase family protein [Peptoclostridium sp.]MZQ75828.1 AMIN domain-containing protein [Peptoclostridium sp.]
MKKNFLWFVSVIVTYMLCFTGMAFAVGEKTEKFIIDEKLQNAYVVDLSIDGKAVNADVPPIILNDRTLLPVRAVSEGIGCNVTWNQKTSEVTIEREYKTIKLKIDSSDVYVNGVKKKLPDNVPAKIVTYKNSGRTMVPARFVLEELGASVDWNSKTRTLAVKSPDSAFDFGGETNSISLSNIKWSGNEARIVTSSKPEFKDYVLAGPERLVVDLQNTRFDMSAYTSNVSEGAVSKIRASQFGLDPLVSRVVFDLNEGSSYKITAASDGIIIKFEQDKPVVPEIIDEGQPLTYGMGAAATKLKIALDSTVKLLDSEYSKSEGKLSLKFDSKYFKNEAMQAAINDTYLKKVTVSKASSGYTYVNAYLSDGAKYDIKNSSTAVEVTFTRERAAKPLIVIDAGHGGKDPGAVGIDTKVTEKEIVIDIAGKLQRLLEDEGYKTIMTREDDTFVDLYKRAAIANEAGADIFLSIHINASTSRSVSGIETLYYPSSTSSSGEVDLYDVSAGTASISKLKPSTDGKGLARTLQDVLIAEMKTANRGIVERPKLVVLNQTKMTASLVELGFISNSNEETLLRTDEYRQRLADALLKGIKEYFSN